MSLEPTTAYTRKHYGMHCACATTVDRLTAENAALKLEFLDFADEIDRLSSGEASSATLNRVNTAACQAKLRYDRAALQEGQG